MRTIKHLHGLQTALPIWHQAHHIVLDLIILLNHIFITNESVETSVNWKNKLGKKKKTDSKSRKWHHQRRNEWLTHQDNREYWAPVRDSHEEEATQGSPTLHQHIVYLLVKNNLGPRSNQTQAYYHSSCISYCFLFNIWLEKRFISLSNITSKFLR